MGVFDFVKHGTEEMQLARPAASREPLVVHPERSLPLFGQLVVEEGDAAVFATPASHPQHANPQRVIGIVGAGRHVLHPSKLPFLENLEDDAHPGRIAVQLVFLRLAPIDGSPFSAKLDPLADPASLAAVSPLLDGVLSVQVVDPVVFVEEHLSGTDKPILGRKGIIVTLDRVRFALEGRRIAVFGGKGLPQRIEASVEAPRPSRPSRPSSVGSAITSLACRACGEVGELGKFCATCGALVTDRDQCVACRAELRPNARFCQSCGVRAAVT